MKRFVIIIMSLFFFNQTFACLNGESKDLRNGTLLYLDKEESVPHGHNFLDKRNFETEIIQLDSLFTATKDLDYLSDKGLLLILLERYDEAIKLYLEIEEIEPNRYSTASNIGTAFELTGQNENALKWIKKSVEINPKSHYSSEWIHVKILEAKIKGEQFYTTNFLLKTDFGSEIMPNSQMTKQELQNLSDALYYQLNERISFVKPKDQIVAQLLFDLGNIAFLLGSYYNALGDYKQAKLYGYDGKLIEQRIKQIEISIKKSEQQAEHNKTEKIYITSGLWIISGLILIILIGVIYKRKKKNIN